VQKSTPATGNVNVFIHVIGNGNINYNVADLSGKSLQSGTSAGYVFDDKLNIFTASKVRAHHVAALVYSF
jgi:hypothetical protein